MLAPGLKVQKLFTPAKASELVAQVDFFVSITTFVGVGRCTATQETDVAQRFRVSGFAEPSPMKSLTASKALKSSFGPRLRGLNAPKSSNPQNALGLGFRV